jgi:hypothetical protein
METTGVVRSDLVRTRCIETMASLASRPGVPIEQNRVRPLVFLSILPLMLVFLRKSESDSSQCLVHHQGYSFPQTCSSPC